jgi:hypothetical protein
VALARGVVVGFKVQFSLRFTPLPSALQYALPIHSASPRKIQRKINVLMPNRTGLNICIETESKAKWNPIDGSTSSQSRSINDGTLAGRASTLCVN